MSISRTVRFQWRFGRRSSSPCCGTRRDACSGPASGHALLQGQELLSAQHLDNDLFMGQAIQPFPVYRQTRPRPPSGKVGQLQSSHSTYSVYWPRVNGLKVCLSNLLVRRGEASDGSQIRGSGDLHSQTNRVPVWRQRQRGSRKQSNQQQRDSCGSGDRSRRSSQRKQKPRCIRPHFRSSSELHRPMGQPELHYPDEETGRGRAYSHGF